MGEPEQPQAKRILVVDDDYLMTDWLRAALTDMGYAVDVAASDHALALALEQRQKPDLIILDIALPGMDGTEIGYLLRSSPSTAAIPVLMLSGDRQVEQKASRIHVKNWLAKPVELEQLGAKIEAMLVQKPSIADTSLEAEDTA